MSENKEIERLKVKWRKAMKRKREAEKQKKQATNDVNHYARLITEARKKENGE